MSIQYKVLGKPGRDNALFVWLNSGTKLYRLLFDCGENIFYRIKQSDIKNLDYLFFSHLHIDHIAGFDYYFRRNFERMKPNFIFGPEDTSEIIHHRLQGFKWNLTDESPGEFIVTDIAENKLSSSRFITDESFRARHNLPEKIFDGLILQNSDFTIKAALLNHRIHSTGYCVTEKDSINISKEALKKSGLTPGSWLESVRNMEIPGNSKIEIDNNNFVIGDLRKSLLRISKGEGICYLTDFLFDDASRDKSIQLASDCDTLVCESQYNMHDYKLAEQNFHLTSLQAAELAKEACVKKLVLFHVSERYASNGSFAKLLEDARAIFPETYFPDHWTENIEP